jgi:hypothetical protein
MLPPPLTPAQWSTVMEEDRIVEVTDRLQKSGYFTANDVIAEKYCVYDKDIAVRFHVLVHVCQNLRNDPSHPSSCRSGAGVGSTPLPQRHLGGMVVTPCAYVRLVCSCWPLRA